MRLLFDQNISFRVVNLLKDTFPNARHVKDFDLQFSSDREIWQFAKSNQYHIVTFDTDFYDLVTLYSYPPKIIWMRLGNTSTVNLSSIILKNCDQIASFVDENQIEFGCLEITH